jgi:mono/diheme cytochrome c family protein
MMKLQVLIPLAVPCLAALVGVAGAAAPAQTAAPSPPVAFNRDIRPIFSDNCFQCHGPDQAKRKADLRLDTETGAFADLGGYRALAPGDLARSELYRRITAPDGKERMPPPRSGRKLTARQIALIKAWIEQGARWQKHWAFLPPQRHAPPQPEASAEWIRNPIDAFVLQRLRRAGLQPSPPADPVTLIRRVTLDLTGLPPTPKEVDAFLADPSPAAYAKVVDRLLASPRYGERLAVRWLDAARYADTNGYQTDGERTMWGWRDWVLGAYNRNLPFDRFTIEQLAGDLLPQPTLDQRIATGFNRNHRGNAEGGIIPEEYAVEYVVDRVDTTSTVWLGLTMGCARCHDHKYDPFTQKDFYRLFAFFNNVPERGKAIKFGNSPPVIKSPTPDQQTQLRRLDRQQADAKAAFACLAPNLDAAQARWEQSLTRHSHGPSSRSAVPALDWSPTRRLQARYCLGGDTADQTNHAKPATFRDGAPAYAAGRRGQAGDFDGKRYLDAGDVGDFAFEDRFSVSAWVYPRGPRGGVVVSRMVDVDQGEGYHLRLQNGKVQVNLVKRWLDDALRVETERSLPPDRWYHILMTYDGSRVASGITVYVYGRPEKLMVQLDDLNQSFQTAQPLRIGAGAGPRARFHGLIADVRVYDDHLSQAEVEAIATYDPISAIVARPPGQRTGAQARKLRAYYLEKNAPEKFRQAHRRVLVLDRQKEQLIRNLPTTMVMVEMPRPRDTFILIRGQYNKPGPGVTPGVPASLPSMGRSARPNRLGLAHWLVDPANPLTARVAVNRYWQMYFGTGLVKTAEDFGSQGEWPSHPELFDWLATEFVRSGWNVKAMQRLIVTSATYRQSAKVTRELLYRDPDNRLLARGPRLRLSAEMIRDQALAAAGLLVQCLGGPSVKPYQPAGLWRELADAVYKQDHGPSLYRRSLYTFWKRTIAPPSMVTFDAAGREACTVRKARTNTPLQALTLMNDVTFVEAARVLAQRVIIQGGAKPDERITLAFRLLTGRRPRPVELQILRAGLEEHLAHYRTDRAAALKLVSAGESPRDKRLDVGELAAYTAVASLILNLDEAITKE